MPNFYKANLHHSSDRLEKQLRWRVRTGKIQQVSELSRIEYGGERQLTEGDSLQQPKGQLEFTQKSGGLVKEESFEFGWAEVIQT